MHNDIRAYHTNGFREKTKTSLIFIHTQEHTNTYAEDKNSKRIYEWVSQKKKVVGLERGPLSLVSTTEELLDRKVAAPV
jgi:radical SAM superfamily enzyme